VKNRLRVTGDLLKDADPNLKILHPLPRVNEITADVDATPHARYFEQAFYGVPIRMALLALAMGMIE